MVRFLLISELCWLVPNGKPMGVPTSTVDDPHCPSPVLVELAVVAIASFLSEFERLDGVWKRGLPVGSITAIARCRRRLRLDSRIGARLQPATANRTGEHRGDVTAAAEHRCGSRPVSSDTCLVDDASEEAHR